MNRGFFFNDTTSHSRLRVRLLVFLDHVNARNNQAIFSQYADDLTAFALVATGDNNHFVITFNLTHLSALDSQPAYLKYFGSQRNDFHEFLATQLTSHWSENTGANRSILVVQQYGSIIVKLD